MNLSPQITSSTHSFCVNESVKLDRGKYLQHTGDEEKEDKNKQGKQDFLLLPYDAAESSHSVG